MLKNKIAFFINKIKELYGDPHYVSLGMAIGVFVAITPTIPFHTVIAVALAVLFKASKPAAIIGVWVSNPFTVFFLYFACYKTGHIFFEDSLGELESIKLLIDYLENTEIELAQKISYFAEFIETKIQTFMIMIVGGIMLGLPSGLASYFIFKGFLIRLKRKKMEKKAIK